MKTVALATMSYAVFAAAPACLLSLSLLVAAISTPILLPLLRSGHWLGTALFYGLGGLVLGGVALLIVKGWPGARAYSVN